MNFHFLAKKTKNKMKCFMGPETKK